MTVTLFLGACMKLLSNSPATPMCGRGYIRPWDLCSTPVFPIQSSVCAWGRARHLLQILALAAEHPLLRDAVKGCADRRGQSQISVPLRSLLLFPLRAGPSVND